MSILSPGLARIEIPVPPMEVQREIAGILTKMESLALELEEEQAARAAQQAHYRAELLSEGSLLRAGCEWHSLGDVASVRTGVAPLAGELSEDGPFAFVNAGAGASGRIGAANTERGTVTIPSRGQGGVGIVGYQFEDFWCGPLCYRVRSTDARLETRFLYHYLKHVQPSIQRLQQTGGTPALNRKELVTVPVPVPPPAFQERVCSLLDRFDQLLTSDDAGLPSEVAMRRKQFEYYRDRLFDFSRLAA
jgi:type I restriction enzyme S subunit